MDSPQKTSPDTSPTIPFRRGHPTLISATIIDLAILRVTVRILHFSVQIWILLEFSSPISKGTSLGPSDLESPQESTPVIPISSILSWF
jgi:hypothetical protein